MQVSPAIRYTIGTAVKPLDSGPIAAPVPLPYRLPPLDGLAAHSVRQVQRQQHLFRSGQAFRSLFVVRSGLFKTSIVSSDGREKVTGFRMRGELLGIEAIGSAIHGCDAVALEDSEVLVLPYARLAESDSIPSPLHAQLAPALATEMRRDWAWMLTLGTLGAEQRVAAFLLDLGQRQPGTRHLRLPMKRAEIGSFLAMTLETVTRTLSRLSAAGLIDVSKRMISLNDIAGLNAMLGESRTLH